MLSFQYGMTSDRRRPSRPTPSRIARMSCSSVQRPIPVSGSGVRLRATWRSLRLRMSPAPYIDAIGSTRSLSCMGEWHSKHSQTPSAR